MPVVFEHSPYRGDTGEPAQPRRSTSTTCRRSAARARARSARRPRAAGAPRARPRGPQADLPGSARQLLRAARLRGRARREHRHVQLAGLPGRRRRRRDARHQGRDRLAQRPRARLRRRRQPGDAPAGPPATSAWSAPPTTARCPTRSRRPASRACKTIIPVSAISSWYDYYRANGLVVAPHSNTNGAGDNGYLGEDTDVLGDYIGGPRMEDPSGECRFMHDYLLAEQDRVTGDYSAVLGRARLPRQGRPDPRERVRRPRPQRLQRQDEGVRRVVVPARRERRRAQDLAAQRRPRRPGRRRRDAPSPDAQHRWFDHYLFGVAQRHRRRADGDRAARGRHLLPARPTGRRRARATRRSSSARARAPRRARCRPSAERRRRRRSPTAAASSTPTTC